jgi:hypothetical protein
MMGAVLPGDATIFQVTYPVRLADGDYLVSAVLDYEGKTAILEGAEIRVEDGQPEVGCEPDEEEAALPPESIPEIVPPPAQEGGSSIGSFVALAVALGAPLVALVLAALIWRRARRRRA